MELIRLQHSCWSSALRRGSANLKSPLLTVPSLKNLVYDGQQACCFPDLRYAPLTQRKHRLRSMLPPDALACCTAIPSRVMERRCSGLPARTIWRGSSRNANIIPPPIRQPGGRSETQRARSEMRKEGRSVCPRTGKRPVGVEGLY